jgi:Na+-exporting ATPase
MRRSFFRMKSKPENPFTQWAHNVWSNKFLFWSVFAGFITVLPIIYIPGLNTVVFKHGPISWEWGVVLVESALFVAGIEVWKGYKRAYFRRYGEQVSSPEKELSGSKLVRSTKNWGTGLEKDVEAQG